MYTLKDKKDSRWHNNIISDRDYINLPPEKKNLYKKKDEIDSSYCCTNDMEDDMPEEYP